MKSLVSLGFMCAVFLFSCTRNEKANNEDRQIQPELRTEEIPKLDSLPWNAEYDTRSLDLKLRKSSISLTNVSVSDMIAAVNRKYPNVKLELRKLSDGVLTLKIADASYLTQQMGTAGADTYLAEVTFSFTELPGIKTVIFEFEEGDHAIPGAYTRKSFENFN